LYERHVRRRRHGAHHVLQGGAAREVVVLRRSTGATRSPVRGNRAKRSRWWQRKPSLRESSLGAYAHPSERSLCGGRCEVAPSIDILSGIAGRRFGLWPEQLRRHGCWHRFTGNPGCARASNGRVHRVLPFERGTRIHLAHDMRTSGDRGIPSPAPPEALSLPALNSGACRACWSASSERAAHPGTIGRTARGKVGSRSTWENPPRSPAVAGSGPGTQKSNTCPPSLGEGPDLSWPMSVGELTARQPARRRSPLKNRAQREQAPRRAPGGSRPHRSSGPSAPLDLTAIAPIW